MRLNSRAISAEVGRVISSCWQIGLQSITISGMPNRLIKENSQQGLLGTVGNSVAVMFSWKLNSMLKYYQPFRVLLLCMFWIVAAQWQSNKTYHRQLLFSIFNKPTPTNLSHARWHSSLLHTVALNNTRLLWLHTSYLEFHTNMACSFCTLSDPSSDLFDSLSESMRGSPDIKLCSTYCNIWASKRAHGYS